MEFRRVFIIVYIFLQATIHMKFLLQQIWRQKTLKKKKERNFLIDSKHS